MKNILTLLFCIVCINCFGQKKPIPDSVYYILQDTLTGEVSYSELMPYSEPAYTPKCDTVQVVLLICNKLNYSNHTPTIQGDFDRAGAVMWVTAYSVRKEDIEYGNPFNGEGNEKEITWEHLYYLDSYYRPLSKNIIVWMAKEL